jgi:cation diffusion facilitator CzcD-associated flavoprotein CzcO
MSSAPAAPSPGSIPGDFPIAIIGAGFAGIGMAIKLKQAGIDSFVMFERAGEIGGTWRDNTYPGAACDVPSHAYSLSFEPNPDWSRAYSPSEEIQAYLLRIVDKHGLRRHLRLNTGIRKAEFDEEAGLWTLETSAGDSVQARAVVSGVGGLTEPNFPDIEGLERFQGKTIHTARWDHDYDLTGKRVAVIGTGCSAIQVIPSIADQVSHMTVFQRTAAWVVPKMDRVFSEKTKERFRNHPLTRKALRAATFFFAEGFIGPMVILNSERLSKIGEKRALRHLEKSVRDPELRKKLTPNFQFGCKRLLISDDYLPTLEREHVELVTDSIDCITERGIRTKDGRKHEFDVLIAATGFDVGFTAAPFEILGRGGRSLSEVWAEGGAQAYKGMTVSGFPNWFIIMGPNTGPGHTSVLVYTESQIGYILQAIDKLRRGGAKYVDVKQAVQDRYNEKLQRRMKHTVWTSGCASWYLAADGKNRALFPGLASEYILSARKFKQHEYDVASA